VADVFYVAGAFGFVVLMLGFVYLYDRTVDHAELEASPVSGETDERDGRGSILA
jgi:hypothetical protein